MADSGPTAKAARGNIDDGLAVWMGVHRHSPCGNRG